jgi:cytochrome c oxidase subunit 1
VAHFHLVMGVAAIFGMFAGTVYWFPKMFGRMMHEGLGKLHFWITFIGVYAIFMPMHYIGVAGHPRRYAETSGVDYLASLQPVHEFITIAAIITIGAQILFVINVFWSMWGGKKASENPWEATTLEWTIPSPPPHDNFGGNIPVVYRGPYEYSVPGVEQDYIMQTTPDSEVVKSKKG